MTFESSPQPYDPEKDAESGEIFDTEKAMDGVFELPAKHLTATISNSMVEYFIKTTQDLAKAFDVEISLETEYEGVLQTRFRITATGDSENVYDFEQNMRDFGR